MPRRYKRVSPPFAWALSIDATAEAIDHSPVYVRRMIDEGKLRCWTDPETQRRRVTFVDLVEFIKNFWLSSQEVPTCQSQPKRKKKSKPRASAKA